MTKELLTGADLKGPLLLTTGTSSVAPLKFLSGTNLTSAAAGAMEYDGKVLYSTPAGRGVSPSMMVYRLNSTRTGTNNTAATSIFGAGVSLQASTVYAFEMRLVMRKTVGTTSHDIRLQMNSSSALGTILYTGVSATFASPSTSGNSNTTVSFYGATEGNVAILTGITTANIQAQCTLQGNFDTGSATTFTPNYTLSAAPGGAYTTQVGTYFAIWPIGAAGANTSVGPWA
jgi:hypothetical protein